MRFNEAEAHLKGRSPGTLVLATLPDDSRCLLALEDPDRMLPFVETDARVEMRAAFVDIDETWCTPIVVRVSTPCGRTVPLYFVGYEWWSDMDSNPWTRQKHVRLHVYDTAGGRTTWTLPNPLQSRMSELEALRVAKGEAVRAVPGAQVAMLRHFKSRDSMWQAFERPHHVLRFE